MKSNDVGVESAYKCDGVLKVTDRAPTAYGKSRRIGASKIMRAGRDQGDRWGLLAWRLGSLFTEAKNAKCV